MELLLGRLLLWTDLQWLFKMRSNCSRSIYWLSLFHPALIPSTVYTASKWRLCTMTTTCYYDILRWTASLCFSLIWWECQHFEFLMFICMDELAQMKYSKTTRKCITHSLMSYLFKECQAVITNAAYYKIAYSIAARSLHVQIWVRKDFFFLEATEFQLITLMEIVQSESFFYTFFFLLHFFPECKNKVYTKCFAFIMHKWTAAD